MSPSQEELRLRKKLQALLQGRKRTPTWKELWLLAQHLFKLRLFLHHNHAETLALFQQAELAIQRSSEIFFAKLSHAKEQNHLHLTIRALQHNLEQTIGDLSRSHQETLEKLQQLQASLDALQWLSEQCPPLTHSNHLTAEALADLSLLERELHQVRTALKEQHISQKLQTTQAHTPQAQSAQAHTPQAQEESRARFDETDSEASKERYSSGSTEGLAESAKEASVSEKNAKPIASPEELRVEAEQLRQGCAQLYGTLLTREMEQFLQHTKQGEECAKECTLQDLNRTWLWLQHGEELRLSFQREKLRRGTYVPGKLASLNAQIEQRCEELHQRMSRCSADLPTALTREWWAQHLRFLLDDIDDQLATLDDQAIELALRQLQQMERQTSWLTAILEPLQKAEPSPSPDTEKEFQLAIRQWKRIRYRLKVERQERKLQSTLEEKLGPLFAKRMETTVLVLILLVLVFLVVEFSFHLSPTTTYLLMWADTFICLFFLMEFGTKWALAEGRWLYFKRHFLIDLLPAIPFGFILWTFQAQSVLAHLTAGRAVRLARLSRFARYIRIIRPFIRLFRLFSFLVRAIGSVLRKYESLFNRNIIIFPSPEESYIPQQQRLQFEVQQLRERCRRRLRMHIHHLTTEEKLSFVRAQLSHLQDHFERFSNADQPLEPTPQATDVVYLPKLIHRMIHMDAIEVEEVLGRGFVQQSYRIFSYLSFPSIGKIPGFRRIAKVYKQQDPAALLAWVIRLWGRFLQRIQNLIHWFGDLHGIITGPQVLDRIGTAMVNATLRPARRLLLSGFFFLLISGLISAFSISFLKNTATFLAKFLGTPIIVLGSISLIPLALGFWFRRIASASSDFFGRVAEAQFIGHLKQVKRNQTPGDLEHLIQRVLQPEALLRQREMPTQEELVPQLIRQLQGIGELEEHHKTTTVEHQSLSKETEGVASASKSETGSARYLDRDRVLLLYEDYLGGSPLHRSDTPTTNQLLGNITIQNIRRHRLTLSLFDNMRIDRLDLSRPRLLHFLGPYLWFTAITESLSHRVARLIVEYNQNCVTLTEKRWQSETSREANEAWLQQREERIQGKILLQEDDANKEQEFRTTAFTALHFLSNNENRDEAIRETFGPRVVALVQAERRLLFRELFGFFPFHKLPKESRTVNIYQLYLNHLEGGRFFLFPFKMLWWFFKNLFWMVGRIRQLVLDVLKPPSQDDVAQAGHAPFEVAIRKINRMRKPIYVEYMRLRAMLDVEYLGLYLPGLNRSGVEGHTYQADLDFISASEKEHLEFNHLSHERAKQLHLFDEFLRHYKWKGEMIKTYLRTIDPALARQWRAVLRALTSAFAADYHKVRSLMEAENSMRQLFKKGCDMESSVPKRRRWWAHFKRWLNRVVLLQADQEYGAFLQHWKRSTFAEFGDDAMRRCWHLYLSRRKQMYPTLLLVTEGEESPWERIHAVLDEVIRNNSIWTEELLTMRTLQTITQLDLRLYRELVYTLGDYHEPEMFEAP